MSYSVIAVPRFKKELKKLSKKYRSLKREFAELVQSLEDQPIQGDALGNNCYKIRLGIESKGKGKSGGGRVITNVLVAGKVVYLLSIYDKSDRDTISTQELSELMKSI